MTLLGEFVSRMVRTYKGRHFEVDEAELVDGQVVRVTEHNGRMGLDKFLIGEPLELRLSRRDVVAARARGGLEQLLREKSDELHAWAKLREPEPPKPPRPRRRNKLRLHWRKKWTRR